MVQSVIQSRVGILLNLLGEDVSKSLMEQLPENQAGRLKNILAEIEAFPPDNEEIDEALEEFERSLALIASAIQEDEEEASHSGKGSHSGSDADEMVAEPTEDPYHDLSQLTPSQLARVLETENSRAASVVLGCVDADIAAAALEEFPDDLGKAVFLHSQNPPKVTDSVKRLLVELAFERGRLFAREKPIDPDEAAIQRLADMLRKMERTLRKNMLDRLREADAETAELVSNKLYIFEDILTVTDRSVQALLAQVNSTTLATALKDEPETISNKILLNMSKRARASLVEEIEFLGTVTVPEKEDAKQQICKAMAALDEKGQLEVEEP